MLKKTLNVCYKDGTSDDCDLAEDSDVEFICSGKLVSFKERDSNDTIFISTDVITGMRLHAEDVLTDGEIEEYRSDDS